MNIVNREFKGIDKGPKEATGKPRHVDMHTVPSGGTLWVQMDGDHGSFQAFETTQEPESKLALRDGFRGRGSKCHLCLNTRLFADRWRRS